MSAAAWCAGCRAPIERWRERLTPVRDGQLVLVDGELAVRVSAPAACSGCKGDDVVICVSDEEGG